VQTQKVTRFPVILYGSAYWSGLVNWIRETVLANGKVNAPDIDLMHVTDDVDDAVAVIIEAERARSRQLEVERAVAVEGPRSKTHDGQ
jgi:predicted Rossmann-fold nucleotide-binding protein